MREFFGGKKFNFLVVDDDPGIREVVKIHLEHEGHKVTLAVDGDDCIKKLTKDTDIILLDVKMPGKRSKDIIKETKIKSPKAVIVYLTSVKMFEPTKNETQMEWTPVIEPPVIGYIQKPVMRDDLFSKIEKYLKQNKLIMGNTTKTKRIIKKSITKTKKIK